MKTDLKFAIFLIVLLLAMAASATMYRGPNGWRGEILPTTIPGSRNNVPASYWLDSGKYWVETPEQLTEWQTAQSNAAAQAAVQFQADKSDALKSAENNFFYLCAALFAGDMTKRGFAELTPVIESIMATNQAQGITLSLKLLAVDAEAKREGGLNWWDTATFHPEAVE